MSGGQTDEMLSDGHIRTIGSRASMQEHHRMPENQSVNQYRAAAASSMVAVNKNAQIYRRVAGERRNIFAVGARVRRPERCSAASLLKYK